MINFNTLLKFIIPIILTIIVTSLIIYTYVGKYRDDILMKPLLRTISVGFIIRTIILFIFMIFLKKYNLSFLINLIFVGFTMIYSIYYFLNDVGDSISENVLKDALYILSIIILISIYQP